MINYILIAVISNGGWANIEIQKPQKFITECLHDGRRWHEQSIQDRINNSFGRVNTMIWRCVPTSR